MAEVVSKVLSGNGEKLFLNLILTLLESLLKFPIELEQL